MRSRTTTGFVIAAFFTFAILFSAFASQDKEKPHSSEKFRTLFSKLRTLENLDEKVKLIEAFLAEVPEGIEHYRVKFRLGWEYFYAGHDEIAKGIFREVAYQAKEAEIIARSLQYLGRTLMNIGALSEAKTVFNDIIKRFPDAIEAKLAENCLREIEHIRVGKVPPPLEGRDMNGQSFSLKDYRGKVTLINFWALNSVPSLKEMEYLVAVYQIYNHAGFDILGISLDTKMENLRDFLTKEKIPWRVACDGKGWKSKYALLYNVQFRIPTNILLDRRGVIRYKNLKGRDLEEAVKALIGRE